MAGYTINYTKNQKNDKKGTADIPQKLYVVKYHSIKLDRVVTQSKLYKTSLTDKNIQTAIDNFVNDCKVNSMKVYEYNLTK